MNFNQYLTGISEELGGLGEVETFRVVFQDYKLAFFDDPPFKNYPIPDVPRRQVWYIVGAQGVKEHGSTSFYQPQILISLLNLGKEIEEKQAFGTKNELVLSDEVINWCKEYGIPYEERYFRENAYKDEEGNLKNKQDYVSQNGEKPSTNLSGFRLGDFKRRIVILYGLFNLWYGLFFDDFKKVIEFSPLVEQYDSNKDLNKQILDLKTYLPFRIQMEMNTELGLKYDESKDKYMITPLTNNLLSVAYFQFAMLMTSNGVGNGVRFCSMCGKIFEIEHGNKKICPKCERDYHMNYMRERRQKGKS
jgi:hypothetical protein